MVTTRGLAGVILAIASSKTGIKATDSNMGEKLLSMSGEQFP
jgi:hypothetical protein